MRFAVALLWVLSISFVAFGLGFMLMPQGLSQLLTGAVPSTTNAAIDMRATYGGVALGLGAFLGFTAVQSASVRLGLVASLFVVAAIAAGRVVGLVVDGTPNAFMIGFLALELVFLVLIVVGLRGVRATAG